MSIARRCREGMEVAHGGPWVGRPLWTAYDAEYLDAEKDPYPTLDESLFNHMLRQGGRYTDADPETYLHAIDAWIRAIDNWEPE